MSGPWEKYKNEEVKKGPWEKYSGDDTPEKSGVLDAAIRGGAQGATLGFADEITAGTMGLRDYLQAKMGQRGDISLEDAYTTNRDVIRKADQTAKEENPGTYTGAELGGGILTAVAPAGAAAKAAQGFKGLAGTAAVGGAAIGGMQGLGASNADLTEGDFGGAALDTGIGAGLGAAGGAAGVGLGKLGGMGIDKARQIAGKVGSKFRTAPHKIAKSVLGIDEGDIAHYMNNKKMVDNAPGLDDIGANVRNTLDDLGAQFDDAQGTLANAKLAKQNAPNEMADELLAAMDNEKSMLGSLSEQADDALERGGATYKRDDLLGLVDDIGGKQPSLTMSDSEAAVTNMLKNKRQMVSEFPEELSAPEIRALMRGVRKDIGKFSNYGGEFDPDKTRVLKELQGKMSSALKTDSPEYAGYMNRMAPLAGSLDETSKAFGKNPAGGLRGLGKPSGHQKGEVLKNFDELTGNDFYSRLNQLDDGINTAQTSLAGAKSAKDAVKAIRPEHVESTLKKIGKSATHDQEMALWDLSNRAGTDFVDQARNSNVGAAFGKDATRGSRNVNMGAMAGLMLGGPTSVLPLATSAAGYVADRHGGQIAKHVLGKMSQRTAKTTPAQIQSILKIAPERLGIYAGPLRNAMQKGEQAVSATHFLQYKKDPKYRDLMNTLDDENPDEDEEFGPDY